MLANTKHSVEYELKKGFVSVPKGCYIHLEKKASEYVLQNIRSSIETKSGIVSKICSFTEDTGKQLTLANFLDRFRLDPRAIYKKDNFSRLCVNARVLENFNESNEREMTKAFARLASIDSRRLLQFMIDVLQNIEHINLNSFDQVQKRMLRMFYATVWMKTMDEDGVDKVYENFDVLRHSKTLLNEMIDLLKYQYAHIDFVDQKMDFGFDCPIDLHCTYSRDQILLALDYMRPNIVREGVKWLPDHKIDVLFVTLNKSDKDYSPTTMYNDYSINDTLFHWQSQSTTSEESITGQRYIHHQEQGSKVLLCVRESKKDAWGNAAPYCVLGFVNYVKHTGSKPMNITWELDEKIPAKYLKQTKKLIVS